MTTRLSTYYLADGDRIRAASIEDFVRELHLGSRFDSEGTTEAYMVRFAERYAQLHAVQLRTDTMAHFFEDLRSAGYIERIEP